MDELKYQRTPCHDALTTGKKAAADNVLEDA